LNRINNLTISEKMEEIIIPIAISAISIFLPIYHLYCGGLGEPESTLFRVTHLSFILILACLVYPLKKKRTAIDFILIFIVIFSLIYIIRDTDAWYMKLGNLTTFDKILGILYIIVVLEATRRVVGWPMVILAIFFIFNARFGNFFPGVFYGAPHSWDFVVDILFVQELGIFGIPIMVTASYVFLFIILGQLFLKLGVADLFIDVALALTGTQKGGPAKAAVVSSAMVGSISGSAVANVVTTGTFTIPLMKKVGYKSQFAGAVEAAASTGGQIMPPIMGTAAFIIAQFLGIPYLAVVKAAILPGIFYFFSVFCMVHFEALKQGLASLPRAELPNLRLIVKRKWYLFIPIFVLLYILLSGSSVIKAAFWSIITTMLIGIINKNSHKMTPRLLMSAFNDASFTAIQVSVACACAGIIIGAIQISGLGNRFSGAVIEASGGNLWIALVYVMIASLILGMGMTSTAVYITLASVVIPSLVKFGVYPIGAHLFAFYYGVISVITPPVALAAYAAAGLAGSNPNKTGYQAFKIAGAAYILPFLFVYRPEMLMIGNYFSIIRCIFCLIFGVITLSSALEGWFFREVNYLERFLLVVNGILFLKADVYSNVGGILLFLLIIIIQKKTKYSFSFKSTKKTLSWLNSFDLSGFFHKSGSFFNFKAKFVKKNLKIEKKAPINTACKDISFFSPFSDYSEGYFKDISHPKMKRIIKLEWLVLLIGVFLVFCIKKCNLMLENYNLFLIIMLVSSVLISILFWVSINKFVFKKILDKTLGGKIK